MTLNPELTSIVSRSKSGVSHTPNVSRDIDNAVESLSRLLMDDISSKGVSIVSVNPPSVGVVWSQATGSAMVSVTVSATVENRAQ